MPAKAVTVIHTVASLTPNSGVTPVIHDYMRHRASAGLPSRCLYFGDAAGLSTDTSNEFIALHKPSTPWAQFSTFSHALAKTIDGLRPKGETVVIHDHGLWLPSNLAAARTAKRMGCPYVISPHGMLQPQAMAHTSLKKRLAWTLYEKRRLLEASFLHVASDIEAEAVSKQLASARLVQVPLGVRVTPRFDALSANRRRDVIYLGRLHRLKGISLLLKAWQSTRQPGWRLKLVGPCDATYRQQLEHEVAYLQIEDSVTFVGPLYAADKINLLLESAVLVLPSFTENFGMVVAEALAHGLPVITTDTTPWHSLESKACGWVTAPQASALAQALQNAMNTPMQELEKMGERGRAWMQTSFDLTTLTNRMNAHYLELVGG